MRTRYYFLITLILCLFLGTPVPGTTDQQATPKQLQICLALGSGGAGGLAHIEILRVFDELGIRPARITGTSVGAAIGALYAAGLRADEIEDIFDDFAGSELDALTGIVMSELGITDILRADWSNGGLLDPGGFLDFLAGHVEARTFADLTLPLSVVATDFHTSEPVVIADGDLFQAVRASTAVPGLFAPVERGDQLLIDGGTSKPLPYDLLMGTCERVIAVDVSGNRQRARTAPGMTDALFKTFELMQQSLIREMRRHQEPDLYLKVDTSGVRLLHLNRLPTILEQAQPAAERLRSELKAWTEESKDEQAPWSWRPDWMGSPVR